MCRLDIHVARLFAIGLCIGALALGSGAAAAGATAAPSTPPTAQTGPEGIALRAGGTISLSNGRTISRWAHANTTSIVRRDASPQAQPVGRLHYLTEDGQAEVYMTLRETLVAQTGVTWIDIALPQRPNGTTGWVPANALGPLHAVGGRLVVSRTQLRATLYNQAGNAVWSAPIGIGRLGLPTPAGHFYVREKLRAIGSAIHGPYAIATSAYASPKLSDWPGGGIIGIHGTNQPQLIPGDPSHGCVRMRNNNITRLWHIIAIGTPIDIT
jgi:lipoprotein-anchoring transpeptidase ErfK/SrfK